MTANGKLQLLAVVLTGLTASVLGETLVRLNLEKGFEALDARRKISGSKAAADQLEALSNQITGQMYYITTQVDLKSLKTSISLQEIYPSFVLPECQECMAVKQGDPLIDKFGQVFKIKCPQKDGVLLEDADCLSFSENGRAGKLVFMQESCSRPASTLVMLPSISMRPG